MDIIKSIGFLFKSDTTAATADTKKLSQAMGGLMKDAAGVGLAMQGLDSASAPIRNFFNKSTAAFGEQEAVVKKLQTQLGEGFDVKGLEDFSNVLQDSLGKDNTAVLRQIGQLKALGVESSSLKDAEMAVQGLSGLGMSEGGAIRAISTYLQTGSSTMMNRYIPALRNARTEEEKRMIIQKAIKDGLARTQAGTDSYTGALNRLYKNQEDFFKSIGKLLVEGLNLKEVYNKIAAAVANVTAWIEKLSPRQKTIIASILGVIAVGVPMIVMFGKISAMVTLFGSSLVKAAASITRAVIPAMTALLPILAIAGAMFAGWTLGETIGQIKVGTTTISGYIQIMCLEMSTWWDEMLVGVEEKWTSFTRWLSDTMKGIAGISVSQEEYAQRAKEDEAHAAKKKQLMELINMRKDLDEKSKKMIIDEANKKAIKSPEDFFNRLLENGAKNVDALKQMVVDSWSSISGLFEAGATAVPEMGDLAPGGAGGKKGKGESNFAGAMERGSVEAYSFVVNSTVQDRQLQTLNEIKSSTLRQEEDQRELIEVIESSFETGEIN